MVFKTINEVSEKSKIEVTGSEIIGLIPLNSIINERELEIMGGVHKNIKENLKNFEKSIKLKF